jgi:TolB protein
MKRIFWITGAATATLAVALAQTDFRGVINGNGALPSLAVPDFRGDAQSQAFMATFNQTLWSDLTSAGIFKMIPKGQYPLNVPQQLTDFKGAAGRGASGSSGGMSLSDWASPPAQANYVTIGYGAVQNSLFVLRAWLVDLSIPDPANAGALAKTYIEPLDEGGARKAAHEFGCDVLQRFGSTCLFGTHI